MEKFHRLQLQHVSRLFPLTATPKAIAREKSNPEVGNQKTPVGNVLMTEPDIHHVVKEFCWQRVSSIKVIFQPGSANDLKDVAVQSNIVSIFFFIPDLSSRRC